jgi:hypothetical protein
MLSDDLVSRYVSYIEPLFPEAKKAYGSRGQDTSAHIASKEYTRLLVEFYSLGGSLPKLAKALKVAYPGVRRRVVMNDISVSEIKPIIKAKKEEIPEAIDRVKYERAIGGVDAYHKQLAREYQNGFSLNDLARGLGLSSAAPLYYGVQRALQKSNMWLNP